MFHPDQDKDILPLGSNLGEDGPIVMPSKLLSASNQLSLENHLRLQRVVKVTEQRNQALIDIDDPNYRGRNMNLLNSM